VLVADGGVLVAVGAGVPVTAGAGLFVAAAGVIPDWVPPLQAASSTAIALAKKIDRRVFKTNFHNFALQEF
jgi:hypothetical protein